jgi:leader peptidase (prepilin peptidase)/N-methyltransferase
MMGSFANVCIFRWPRQGSIHKPVRSQCPWCHAIIAWFDNIPLLSYIALGGRCRACGTSISLKYPLVELTMALLWVILYQLINPVSLTAWIVTIGFFYLSFVLVVSAVIDWEWRIIPDLCTLPLIALGLIISVSNPLLPADSGRFYAALLGGMAGFLMPFTLSQIVRFITGKEGVGWGDIKLLAGFGTFIGYQDVFLVYILACMIGVIPVLVGMGVGKIKRFQYIPFGPLLCSAFFLVVLMRLSPTVNQWFNGLRLIF